MDKKRGEEMIMRRGFALLVVAGLVSLVSERGWAEEKVLAGEMITLSGTVERIDKATRQVTLKGEKGKMVTVEVSKNAKRFDEVKVGDKVSVTYGDAVSVRLKKPDEPPVNSEEQVTMKGDRERPGGYTVVKKTMTATIDALDPSVPSVTFVGPGGWKYTRRILDPKIVQQVKDGKIKVGDRVDFSWYLALDITVQ
jgi:hypothetical protein